MAAKTTQNNRIAYTLVIAFAGVVTLGTGLHLYSQQPTDEPAPKGPETAVSHPHAHIR